MEQLPRSDRHERTDDMAARGVVMPREREAARAAPVIRNEGRAYEASYDGVHFIPVPERLAKLMRIGLNVQKKLDEDPLSLDRQFDTITTEAEGLNCHKMVLFARGDISYEHLTNINTDKAKFGGHPEVIKLFNTNRSNTRLFADDIHTFGKVHSNEFPFSVHVFVMKEQKKDAPKKEDEWVPAHSLIWLGIDEAGNEICFHKRGPYFENRFEVTTLEKVIDPYERKPSMFLIIPIQADPAAKPTA